MTAQQFPSRVNLSDNVLFQEIEGECVLLDMASEQYFGLDDVGTRIWRLLSENPDTTSALTELQKIYEVDEETLRADLVKLITELSSKGLVNVEA
jgi:hypothetical protein